MKKAYFNWSTGKDSSLALYKVLQDKEFEIGTLLTNVNGEFRRVSMHGLREELLDRQVKLIGLPLQKIHFSGDVTMSLYDEIMKKEMRKITNQNYNYAIFGDIFLEDLRVYRDKTLKEVNLQGIYPLWKKDTTALLKEFLELGFKAITVCVNAKLLDESFVGRIVDQQFIDDLPDGVDLCGENGEFHTFVFDGPLFKEPVTFDIGEKVLRTYKETEGNCVNYNKPKNEDCYKEKKDQQSWDTGFWYCDLIPNF
ncbi:diphthine--ammonia ligase [Flavicella sp.]|uniref:Dph6-related ATP pyrophosphatase n=1 Tax=Flavicella sp. TaxID=2957742 RepID=UPI003018D63D